MPPPPRPMAPTPPSPTAPLLPVPWPPLLPAPCFPPLSPSSCEQRRDPVSLPLPLCVAHLGDFLKSTDAGAPEILIVLLLTPIL